MLRIGIDIGGTFTDFVVHDLVDGRITTFKILSNPTKPAITVLQGLKIIGLDQPAQIIHGSTVATNALLERKGARTALVTTRGFKDVIEIARQNRPSLYDWSAKPAPVLVPSYLRAEVDERVDYQGNVLTPLEPSQLDEIIKLLTQNNVESVAVCLIFSFLLPQHEQMIVEQLRNSGYFVSASSEILPEYREYERISTTVVNAYVSPILDRYLAKLEADLPNSRIQIMQSNGGMISVNEARQNGVRCILSGPAGGIIGAQNIAQTIMSESSINLPDQAIKIVTFDMGGTSTDVSLIKGQPGLTTEAAIGGCPIHLPILDIHTIGAGGGSIAYVDSGGSLRVGPQSAGAFPGPACYGNGVLPTVTDANLVLGRLIPDRFLGGQMQIDPDRAYAALTTLGTSINLTAIQAAFGVIEVVNAQMERALRVISVERGHYPRDFSLFSFGGAGGLHAIELARHMGIPKVIISKYASTLSAFGMLASNVIKDYVKTIMLPGIIPQETIQNLFSPMVAQGNIEIQNEGIQKDQIEILCSLDVRYTGQSYELNVPYSEDFISDFYKAHSFMYGYAYMDKAIEIVNLRVRAIGKVIPISLPPISTNQIYNDPAPIEYRQVEMSEGSSFLAVFAFERLAPGTKFVGPALIVSSDTTILINKNDVVNVDNYQNLLIDVSLDD
jgi:N-methylhydantoinase A